MNVQWQVSLTKTIAYFDALLKCNNRMHAIAASRSA
jgi:hypothetical protein